MTGFVATISSVTLTIHPMTAIKNPPEVDPNLEEDIRLLKRIAERDPASFQAFYRKYSGLIFASISNVLNDHHDTEDVMQEVLVQVWNKAHLYESRKGKPLTWLIVGAEPIAIADGQESRHRPHPLEAAPLEAEWRLRNREQDRAVRV